MDRLKLDSWCEKAILGLILGILGYSAIATGCVRPQDFVVIQWLTVALMAVRPDRRFGGPEQPRPADAGDAKARISAL